MKKLLALMLSVLLLLTVLMPAAFAAASVQPIAQTVLVDGKEIKFDAYTINGSNYFKLRDMAFILSGTDSQFSLDFDVKGRVMLTQTGKPYKPVGGELSAGTDRSASCRESDWRLSVDGRPVKAAVYVLGGNNYFKLRDLGQIFDFGVSFNASVATVEISTGEGYKAETASFYEPFADSKNKAVSYLKARLDKGCPIVSYETDQIELKSAAFSYDNAVVALAFISNGSKDEAGKILDAFVTGIEYDRYKHDRIRNAYRAGDPKNFPGWWTDQWYEDAYQVGTNVGNSAFVALALMQYDRRWGSDKYVKTARTAMDWVINNCSDTSPGFTAGYDGWPENGSVSIYTYKSTEHNIDAYAAFTRLYKLTGEPKYKTAAESARTFVRSMYSENEGRFYIGTTPDGKTPSTANTVLDTQVWTALSLGDVRGIDCALAMKTAEGGYPFHKANTNGGFWPEGTAFTALTLREMGKSEQAVSALTAMQCIQLKSGGYNAATVPALTTGEGWNYYAVPHIAPAAWYVLAVNGFNPYTF